VASALPALLRAEKLQRRAARVGFDWPDATGVLAKCREELAEIEAAGAAELGHDALAAEVGDLLFSCVNLRVTSASSRSRPCAAHRPSSNAVSGRWSRRWRTRDSRGQADRAPWTPPGNA